MILEPGIFNEMHILQRLNFIQSHCLTQNVTKTLQINFLWDLRRKSLPKFKVQGHFNVKYSEILHNTEVSWVSLNDYGLPTLVSLRSSERGP